MSVPSLNSRALFRALAVVLGAAAGVGAAALLVATGPEATRDQPAELERSVGIITAPEVRWRPRATGFGEAEPARTWRAVAEVSGRIEARHEALESGAILPAGARLFRIEQTDFELALAQAQAALAAREAQLDELAARRENLERSLAIERRRLAVAERELERQERLLGDDSVSQAEVDQQRRALLQQQRAVQELESTLAQIPAERRRLEAQRESDRAQIQRARRDVERTEIAAPFDLRVSAVEAETGQYVRAGEVLMRGDDIGATEVEAEVPVAQFRALLPPDVPRPGDSPARIREVLPQLGLTAGIRLRGAGDGDPVRWQARVDRISDSIDPRTRTVGVVAAVDDPYGRANPPDQPPLVKGMYVEVRLCAPPREPAVVLPRAALHEGRVYVVDGDGRLAVRTPSVRFRHGDFLVVASGIEPGERVVVSDPVPAIAGMKLAPTPEPGTRERLVASARGAGDCP